VTTHTGIGWSDKPDDRQYRYRLDQRLADFTAWLDHVEPTAPIHLIVHDWGGMIGLAWAVRHPERVARLVILNTAAFPMLPGKRLPWTLALVRNTALGAFLVLRLNAFAVGATRFGVVQPLPAEVRRAFVAPYARPAQRIATLRFVQDIPLGPDDPSYATVDATGAALGRLADKPTLICWGLKDFVFDADYLAEFRRRFPSAQVHAFERAGHYLLEDEHERIVPLIRRFLS
jgi:haloalkane dehalogenase